MAHKIKRASQAGVANLKLFLESDKKRFNDFMARKINYKETLNDFEKMQTLGTGSFGRVLLVRHKATNTFYAMKVMNKAKVLLLEQLEHTLNEKKILQCLNYPFVVYMAFAFSDNSYLYFVLPFIIGGEMYTLLRKYKSFDEDLAKFYSAQVVLGLEYLHYLDLVYRDLKPENILIDGTGYIKITDFGFCKQLKGRTYTLCGTPEYLAPEIVLSRGYGNAVDWWSFGVLVFEFNAGFPPFQHKDPMVLYDKIASGKYKVPEHFSIGLRDFVKNMLQVDLSKRFGNLRGGSEDIKDHRWFKQINWMALLNRKLEPPYKPPVKDPREGTNFEKYDEEPLRVSKVDHYAKEFAEF